MKHVETLWSPASGHSIVMSLWQNVIKPALVDGKRLRLTVEPEKRSLDQNAKFHAICEDFAGQEWAGKARDAAEWKVLLVSGHAVATKLGAEVVPGLEGEFVNIRESTARMDKARGSSLIEYAIAYGTQRGVKFKDQA